MLIYPPPPDPLYYYMIPTLMHSKQEQIGRRARNCGEGQDPPLERRGPAGGGGTRSKSYGIQTKINNKKSPNKYK